MKQGSQTDILICRMPYSSSAMRCSLVSLKAIMRVLAVSILVANQRFSGISSTTTASPARNANLTYRKQDRWMLLPVWKVASTSGKSASPELQAQPGKQASIQEEQAPFWCGCQLLVQGVDLIMRPAGIICRLTHQPNLRLGHAHLCEWNSESCPG